MNSKRKEELERVAQLMSEDNLREAFVRLTLRVETLQLQLKQTRGFLQETHEDRRGLEDLIAGRGGVFGGMDG